MIGGEGEVTAAHAAPACRREDGDGGARWRPVGTGTSVDARSIRLAREATAGASGTGRLITVAALVAVVVKLAYDHGPDRVPLGTLGAMIAYNPSPN